MPVGKCWRVPPLPGKPRVNTKKGIEGLVKSPRFCRYSFLGWSKLLQVVPSAQPFNASLRIHDALLTRIKGVAFAADFHTQRRLGGPSEEDVAAGTGNRSIEELWVNLWFHLIKFLASAPIRLSAGAVAVDFG